MRNRTPLVTGFGPFGRFNPNPSQVLAEGLPWECRTIDVSFSAADTFLAEPPLARRHDLLIMLGVSGKSKRIELELFAKNRIGKLADVSGAIREGKIAAEGPAVLGSTLFKNEWGLRGGAGWGPSLDAGDYLCNYTYYRALLHLPSVRVGFIHVPPFEAVDQARQLRALKRLLSRLIAE